MVKVFEKALTVTADTPLVVGFDVEWTKNYQVKNANRAFCYSVVWVPKAVTCNVNRFEDTLNFGFTMHYVESDSSEECQLLCGEANTQVAGVLTKQNTVVGHQFSSDLSVLLACSTFPLLSIEALQQAWRTRRHTVSPCVGIFDTRYDLPDSKTAESNKLVNVCPDWRLGVMQPEIKGSMTKMQRDYYQQKKQYELIREKIAVLNIRHSLSSVLLYLFHEYGKPDAIVNSNAILYRNLKDSFEYVRSLEFATLLPRLPLEVSFANY